MRLTLVAAAALATAVALPAHAASGSVRIAAPQRGDLTVEQLSVSSHTKPVLTLAAPVHGVAAYGAAVPAGHGRWTVRLVVFRTSTKASAVSLKLAASTTWKATNVLHRSTSVPLDGADPSVACPAFGIGFTHLGGDRVNVPLRTVGADACLLAARAAGPLHGLPVKVPKGLQQSYFPVTPGTGVTASPSGFVRSGTIVTFTAPGHTAWTGGCTGAGACTLVVRGPVTVGATFPTAATPSPSAAPSPSASTVTSPSPAALPTRTGARLNEYSIILSHTTVAAGTVQIIGSNGGMDDHHISVRSADGSFVSQEVDVPVNEEATLTVTLAPGTYTVYCDLFDHEMKGMAAQLTVQ